MATVSTLVVALTAQTTDFERGLKTVEKALDRTAARIEDLGASMTAGLTAPLAALATAAAKLAVDFNDPFDKMQAVLGQSAAETDALRDSVLKLAGQTAQSPKELGAALYEVEAAGIRGQAALEVLTAAAEASAIGLGNAKSMASFLAAELNAYGPKALSAAQATSVLVEAARVGRLNIDDLVGSVGAIMPIAAQAGVSFDQVAAAVAAMTRSGLEAGQATTGLRTILETVEKPSASVQKALAMVGLSAAALKDELASKGLLATLDTLKTAFQGDDAALAQVFPSARTFAGVLSLLGANSSETAGIFQKLAATTTGTLGAAFQRAASDDSFKFAQALVQVQTALIRLGQDLLPIVVPLVERFTKAVTELSNWFENLDAGGKDLAVVLASLVASVGPLLLAFAGLYSTLGTVVGALRLFLSFGAVTAVLSAIGTAVTALGEAFGLAAVGIGGAATALETVAAVLAALSGSVLLAVGVVVAAAYLWITKWTELRDDMGQIADFIVEKLAALNTATRGFMSDMFAAMFPGLALLVQLKPAISAALGQAAAVATKAGTDLKDGFLAQMDALEKGVGGALGRALAAAKAASAGIVGSVKGLGAAPAPSTASSGLGPNGMIGPKPQDIQQQISLWQALGSTLQQQGSVMDVTLGAFRENAIQAAQTFKSQVGSMVSATESSMGAMTASFLKGKENVGQFVQDMIEAILKLIAKILLLKALTAAGLGGPFAAGFIGGAFADGGRPPMNKVSVVGENGPELFVPDTAGTIVPNGALGGGGGGATVVINQTVQISGLDLSSAAAAERLAVGLKEAARSGGAAGVALSLQLAQTAQKNGGRSV